MRTHRFLLDQSLATSSFLVTEKEVLHQWSRVFRYTGGEEVILIDGKGTEVLARLRTCSRNEAEVEVKTRTVQASPKEPALTLYFSPLKREFTELVFQKGTELGVSVFQPILCERTVKEGVNAERAVRILKEATEQSGRVWLPEFRSPISFKEALETNTTETTFFASVQTNERAAIERASQRATSLSLFIGPEGGWTEEEENQASKKSHLPFQFSSHILRAETACLAGVAILRFSSPRV